MSEYGKKDLTGVQYCMDSVNARNVEETNRMMGCHDLSNKANRDKQPQGLQGAKVNKQEMGKPKSR